MALFAQTYGGDSALILIPAPALRDGYSTTTSALRNGSIGSRGAHRWLRRELEFSGSLPALRKIPPVLAGQQLLSAGEHGEYPLPDLFYVLKAGEILFASAEFNVAEAHYRELCRLYWDEHLGSADPAASLASAWGLLGLDSEHAGAIKRIGQVGTTADQKRLLQMRNRARYARKPRY